MKPREFAYEVVQRLQSAGYQALWAGGCVRDALLNRTPKDYDVATEATPDQVRDLFGRKRTLAMGASFGVITVLGPKSAGPIEVATFRRDGGYSDGRRPDSVEFTNAREDALRRDFTINGMFFDPIKEEVLDFVGGRQDLESKLIRAIGNPAERIEEDKLRMLRAIRFAATYDFELEPETLAAVKTNAPQIDQVSGERIGAELRRMLAHPNRHRAASLFRESQLLSQLVEDVDDVIAEPGWSNRVQAMQRLKLSSFPPAAFLMLQPALAKQGAGSVSKRWKLSNEERDQLIWLGKHLETIRNSEQLPWSQVQPLLRKKSRQYAEAAIEVLEAVDEKTEGVAFCRERLAWPDLELDPNPLIDGQTLKHLGLTPGPLFKAILDDCRARQLDGEITSAEEAIEIAKAMADASS